MSAAKKLDLQNNNELGFHLEEVRGEWMTIWADGTRWPSSPAEMVLWKKYQASKPVPAYLTFAQPGIFDEE